MAHTSFTDVIIPSVFDPYVINRTMELSALFQSGIATNDAEMNRLASATAPISNLPFFNDLSGDSEVMTEGPIEAAKITTAQDAAPVVRRVKMWAATGLSAALAGSDPMRAIGDLVAAYWSREMQKILIQILAGSMGASNMTGNVLNISGGTDDAAKWSPSAFIDAVGKLGDAQDQLSAVAMHSAVLNELKKKNLIDVERPSMDASFETYQGKRVIVDDGCPVAAGVYTTYIFGAGALALGNGNPLGIVPTETDRNKQTGSGVELLINRKTFILHPRGIRFKGPLASDAGPTNAELATANKWERVYEPKQIRIVAFKHKI